MSATWSRRDFLRAGAAGAAAAALPANILEAMSATPACGPLSSIEHVVILIQENRSFDHYFGRYRGVRGFDDRSVNGAAIFAQQNGTGGTVLPYRMDTTLHAGPGECVNDIEHQWLLQHRTWNGGALDRWVVEHLAIDGPSGVQTMGYYERGDLGFYYALADAFTICDGYHSSVIGGTDINRLYTLTGTMDPDGFDGGAQFLDTLSNRAAFAGKLGTAGRWQTYPQRLSAAGVTWKMYATADSQQLNNVLLYFAAHNSNPDLFQRSFASQNPGPYLADFAADCAAGTLPQVSWLLAGSIDSEHPPAPLEWGMDFTHSVLQAISLNPALWAKTAVFITYDENGGFFDHVPPPVAPAGTPGEYIPHVAPGTKAYTESANGTVLGPIGVGFRVPMLVVSPYTRGGLVCSDLFDHTSVLRFLETRFGVPIPAHDPASKTPGLTPWRRQLVGDMTSAFNFAAAPATTFPALSPIPNRADPRVLAECNVSTSSLVSALGPPYAPPARQTQPAQEPGSAVRPSGLVGCPPASSTGGGAAAAGGAGVSAGSAASLPFSAGPARGLPSGVLEAAAGAVLIGLAWILRRRQASRD